MYTEFYGLTAEPFLLTPDPSFYFDSSVHSQAMAHLLYGLQRGEGFIVVTGEVGAGKTTIVQHLCDTIDRSRVAAAHIVTTLLNGAELIRMVCSAFEMRDIPHAKEDALIRLRAHLEALYRQGRKPLVIIDEAQNLSPAALEELRMLSNFQIGNQAPCQIFLVGQPQFRETMANPNLDQLRQRVIAAYHLGPLAREDCAEYLTHRMRLVNWKNDPEFSPEAIDAIFTHTDGVPRRINTLCSRLLLMGFLDDLHVFSADDVERVAEDLREEQGVRRNGLPAPMDENNYLSVEDDTNLWRRQDYLHARLDEHDRAIRHIFKSLARMIDPEWLTRK
jgi:putative secretion ATPase (PEP-CTERM system associated)